MKAASSHKHSCNNNDQPCTSKKCENLPMQEVESFVQQVLESPMLEVVNSKEHQDTALNTLNNSVAANVIDSTCDPPSLEAVIMEVCEQEQTELFTNNQEKSTREMSTRK